MDYTQKVCRKSLQLFMKHEHQINQLTNCHKNFVKMYQAPAQQYTANITGGIDGWQDRNEG